MIIDKNACKINKFFVANTVFVSFTSIIYANIYLRKIVANNCYFHKK